MCNLLTLKIVLIMTKDELLALGKNGRVDFNGEVEVDSLWDGTQDIPYYARYADADGIHACPNGSEDELDCFTPFGFDEFDDDLFDELARDVI